MGLSLKSLALDPGSTMGIKKYGEKKGMSYDQSLNRIMDPLDLFGKRAGDRLDAAQALQQQAQSQAVAEQERQYRQGLEFMDPYRQYGMRALPRLQESLQPGSQLGTMRSQIGQQYAPQAMGQAGFNPAMIDELMGNYQRAIGAEENTAQTSRARDLMNLGMGGAGMAQGMAGQQGRGLADIYMQGAQMQGQQAVNQALAQRQQGMGAMYGGYRGAMNYLGGAYD